MAATLDQFALSIEVDSEIEGVLNRPKFRMDISTSRIAALLHVLRERACWFRPTLEVSDCRDAKDNKYLALALAAEAANLVSSDADLLVLNPWRGIRILNPRAYLGRETEAHPSPVSPPGAHSP